MAEETRNSENTTAESTTTKEETVKKENIIWKLCKYMIKGTGYLCLFLVPCLSYYLFEYVTGNLENISIRIQSGAVHHELAWAENLPDCLRFLAENWD